MVRTGWGGCNRTWSFSPGGREDLRKKQRDVVGERVKGGKKRKNLGDEISVEKGVDRKNVES